jgi:hypothetical protein
MANDSGFTILVKIKDDISSFKGKLTSLSSEVTGNLSKAFKNLSGTVSEAFNPQKITNFSNQVRQTIGVVGSLNSVLAQNAVQRQAAAGNQTAAGFQSFNGIKGFQGIRYGQGAGFSQYPLRNNALQGGQPGSAPTAPTSPSWISQLTEQFGRAWAVRTLVQTPQALLNAELSNSATPLNVAGQTTALKKYLLDQTSGTNLGTGYAIGAKAYLRRGYTANENVDKSGTYLGGGAVASQNAAFSREAAGGGLQDEVEQGGFGGLLKKALGATVAMGVLGPLAPLATAGGLGAAMADTVVNGPGSYGSAVLGTGTGLLRGGQGINAIASGQPDANYASTTIQSIEELKKLDPLMQKAFDHFAEKAFSMDSYNRRNMNSYGNTVGRYGFSESEGSGMGGAFSEQVGAGRANKMMNPFFMGLRRGGLSAEAASGALTAYSTMNGGNGTSLAGQTSSASKQFTDLLAKAVTAGLDDSQMRDDLVNAVGTSSSGLGGRQDDSLAQAMLAAFKPGMDRSDLKNMVGAYDGITSTYAQKGYMHGRSMSGVQRVLAKYGINDPLMTETMTGLNPFAQHSEMLTNALGGDEGKAKQAMAELNEEKFKPMFLNTTTSSTFKDMMKHAKNKDERGAVLRGMDYKDREAFTRSLLGEFHGDYGKAQAHERLLEAQGLNVRLGDLTKQWYGTNAGTEQFTAAEARDRAKIGKHWAPKKGTNQFRMINGKNVEGEEVDPIAIAKKGAAAEEANEAESLEDLQDPKQLMLRLITNLELFDKYLQKFNNGHTEAPLVPTKAPTK